jgi:hypothetical protein
MGQRSRDPLLAEADDALSSTPSAMDRACHRHTTGFDLPDDPRGTAAMALQMFAKPPRPLAEGRFRKGDASFETNEIGMFAGTCPLFRKPLTATAPKPSCRFFARTPPLRVGSPGGGPTGSMFRPLWRARRCRRGPAGCGRRPSADPPDLPSRQRTRPSCRAEPGPRAPACG